MSERDRVLIVDDDPMNIRVFVELLQNDYTLSIARSGEEALQLLARGNTPDLILLDIMMPGKDGYAVCTEIEAESAWRDIPIIFVTALNQSFDEERGFSVGAVDYISKPIVPSVLVARVKTQLLLRRSQKELQRYNAELETLVSERTHEVTLTQEVMMRALYQLSELRERSSDGLRRIQHSVVALARALSSQALFAPMITQTYLDRLFRAAPLQNIGLIAIPHDIATKGAQLSPEEEVIYRTHPAVGREALLASLAAEASESSEFLQVAVDVIGAHHEKWNGTGYPEGLRGEAIPLSARLVHLVNAYDDFISSPVYNEPGAHDHAIEMIQEGAGRDFDPRLVTAFLSVTEEFRLIAQYYPDKN